VTYTCWREHVLASVWPIRYGAPFSPSLEAAGKGTGASGVVAPGAFFVGPTPTVDAEARSRMIKVEAVVIRERVETVIDAVEEQTGHVGVTVVEAIGHGRQRGITHEYRGRIFESRFLPKALLTFVVRDDRAEGVVAAIADAAHSGNESGDGIVWTTPVGDVTHNRTGMSLEEVEVG
jgi:nitrogen regulatory protein P-II 1